MHIFADLLDEKKTLKRKRKINVLLCKTTSKLLGRRRFKWKGKCFYIFPWDSIINDKIE